MGGAARAIADGPDGLFVNPAGLASKKHYILSANYNWTQEANAHRPGAVIIDSVTTQVAAGIGYNFEHRFNSGDLSIHRLQLGLAYNIGGIFMIGISGKYTIASRLPTSIDKIYEPIDPENPNAPRRALDNAFAVPALNFQGFTGDAGVLFTPIQYFSLAFVGYNLIPNPAIAEFAPIAIGMGAAGHVVGLELDVDAVIDFSTRFKPSARVHFGAEYAIVGMVPVRAGFLIDGVGGDKFWSLGAGFRHTSFGLDLAYRNAIDRSNNRTLAISFEYYMN